MRIAKNLTQGSIHKPLFALAMPILGTSFIQMLYSFTDMAWLGRLDNQSVAAVGAVSMFAWLASSLSLINKVGSEVLVAQCIGENNPKKAARYAGHTSTLSIILGVTIGSIYLLLSSPLLSLYNLAAPIHDKAVSYMHIISVGIPLVACTASYTGTYNAMGYSKVPFVISTLGLVLNMMLDPLCIFVLNLGSDGAGYATLISQTVVYLLFITQMKRIDKLLENFPLITRPELPFVSSILHIGVPVALLNCLFAFINMFMGRMASDTNGHIGVLTLTTGGQLEGITWSTAQGFSTALSAFVSQNYAAGKIKRVLRAFRFTLIMTVSFGLLTSLVYYFWGSHLFRVIVPEIEAYHAGGIYLRINAYSQVFMMVELCSQGLFYGIRKTRIPAAISIGGNLLRIPLALIILAIFPCIEALWWVICFSTILKGCLSLLCYRREEKRLKQLVSVS